MLTRQELLTSVPGAPPKVLAVDAILAAPGGPGALRGCRDRLIAVHRYSMSGLSPRPNRRLTLTNLKAGGDLRALQSQILHLEIL